MSNTKILSQEQLMAMVPAAFNSQKSEKVSDKFVHVTFAEVIEDLRKLGWQPVQARQTKGRTLDSQQNGKHMVRFRQENALFVPGEYVTELVGINANNGTSSYNFNFGVHRVVCANGLVVSVGDFDTVRIRHVGYTTDEIKEASEKVIERMPLIAASIEEMRQVELSYDQRMQFANEAAAIKWPVAETRPNFEAAQLLDARRQEDQGTNLWITLNKTQESLIRGGITGSSASGRRFTSRVVRSVSEDVRINQALWSLAEKYKKAA